MVLAVLAGNQQEELELGAGVIVVAELFGFAQDAHQDVTWIAVEGLAIRCEDAADAAGGGILAAFPGDELEGADVRHEVHVGLGDAGEALDRGAVEPGAMLDRVGELVNRDSDTLYGAGDVGELQVN